MNSLFVMIVMLFSLSAFAQTKVAVVKLIRGEADVLTLGKTTKLKVDDWVENGSVVKTAEKSFVKLIFIDKSQMNVGPNSEMKIESFSGKDSGVIDLVKGKIRSQVTKDYLQMKDKDKSKLFIKTNNALMGVRGTDFMISTNGVNTSTVLFEGEIVFNKLENRESLSSAKMEEIVDKGVRMYPGEFSVQEANRPMPTVPSLLNVQQRERLEKNSEFNSDRSPGNAQNESVKSVVPAGLNGNLVSNSSDVLKKEVGSIESVSTDKVSTQKNVDPAGYVKGDELKPANGSSLHVETGVIVAPAPDSVLDPNTNTYVAGTGVGSIAADGSYIPRPDQEILPNGEIVQKVPNNDGSDSIVPVILGDPVLKPESPQMPNIVDGPTPSVLPVEPVPSDIPLPQPGMDSRFAPTGGIMNVNDPTKGSGFSDTRIIVNPN